jgi:hypothetical protein
MQLLERRIVACLTLLTWEQVWLRGGARGTDAVGVTRTA